MSKALNRATILGCACVVVSKLTPDQIEDFRKYMPEKLQLTDEASGEVIFAIDIDEGPGSLLPDKATYSRTKTSDGLATITIILDPECENKLDLIRERIGQALFFLDKLENRVQESCEMLKNKIHSMDEMIALI